MDMSKATVITENISVRLALGQALEVGVASPTQKDVPENVDNKIGIVKIFDSLVSKGGAGESGFTSYEGIINRSEALRKAGIKTIGFWGDSPGGEALGMLRVSNYIKALPSLGVRTFGFTDGLNCSACYGLLSAVQTLYAMKDSKSGSIGTILTLMDITKRDEQNGIKYTIMRSKDEKALYNPHEVVSEKVAAKAKAELMILDKAFNEIVNKNRPQLSIEQIISLKGNAFYGEEALSLGLVDKLVSGFDEVLALESISTKQTTTRGKTMTLEELQNKVAEQASEIGTLKASLAQATKLGASAEKERILGIISAGSTFKIPLERIIANIEKDRAADVALEIFQGIAEAQGDRTLIDVSNISSTVQTITKSSGSLNEALLAAVDKLGNDNDLQARLL